jgi:hypothetical protein
MLKALQMLRQSRRPPGGWPDVKGYMMQCGDDQEAWLPRLRGRAGLPGAAEGFEFVRKIQRCPLSRLRRTILSKGFNASSDL